jgi:CDP-glycerol glycerophosphotransferase (TagB/SpsB family)
MVGYAYLNNIQADLLVTTTPQLDVMTFRRSARVKHYAILQHALGESRYVRPYAYDFYDSVLCCGEIIKANIRKIEAIRGLPQKALYETGIPHYEELLKSRRELAAASDKPVVLVAPSWGPFSMFESFGVDFLASLARDYQVIVRPHPQMKVSQPELYARVLASSGVTVDTQRTPADAMSRAHVLLSDISGITHEFAFIYERPVVIIDQKRIAGGLEGDLLGGDSELKERCREFIVPVPPEEMPNIAAHIGRTLTNHSAARLTEVRSQLIYNFGRAGDVAAGQLADILARHRSTAGAA